MKGENLARSGSDIENFTTDAAEGIISLEQYFPTGATVALEAGTLIDDSSLYEDNFYTNRLGRTDRRGIAAPGREPVKLSKK